MAANEYLVAAAGHLESAANALKMEADQVRAEFMTYDRQVTHDITSKQAEMTSHNAIAATTPDNDQRLHLQMEVKRLKGEIDQHKRDLDQKRKQMESIVSSKESSMSGIMSQARALRSQAGSLK